MMDEIIETRQAGDLNSGVAEIVVTPEMIDAGARRLAHFVNYETVDTDFHLVVDEVFRSMASVQPGHEVMSVNK